VLRVVRQDDDASLILIWKILNRFPTPQLVLGTLAEALLHPAIDSFGLAGIESLCERHR